LPTSGQVVFVLGMVVERINYNIKVLKKLWINFANANISNEKTCAKINVAKI